MKKLQAIKLALSIILLVAVYTSALPVPKIIIPHSASAASFTLYGSFSMGWGSTSSSITQPGPTLTVQPGESVSLSLFSADGRPHQFCVDYESTPDFVCQGSELATQSPTFSSSTTATPFTFSASTTPGTYTYFCTFHRSAMTGQFIVSSPPPTPDFSISSSPTSMNVQQGSSAISTITLTSLNGFSGTVTLSTNTPSSGLSWKISPTGVTLSSGATITSILTVNASSTAPTGAYQPGGGYLATAYQAGTYQTVVTATNGTLMHSATVTVNVTSSGANAPSLGYLPEVGAAVIIAAIAVVGTLWYRASRARANPKRSLRNSSKSNALAT